MPPRKPALTSTQQKALKKAAATLDHAYAAARKTLVAAGVTRNDEGSTMCLAPPRGHCRSFKPPKHGIRCARSGCGHSLARHDVF